jgi:hypothetical protein
MVLLARKAESRKQKAEMDLRESLDLAADLFLLSAFRFQTKTPSRFREGVLRISCFSAPLLANGALYGAPRYLK